MPTVLLLLPFLGSGFVPTDTMPAALRIFATVGVLDLPRAVKVTDSDRAGAGAGRHKPHQPPDIGPATGRKASIRWSSRSRPPRHHDGRTVSGTGVVEGVSENSQLVVAFQHVSSGFVATETEQNLSGNGFRLSGSRRRGAKCAAAERIAHSVKAVRSLSRASRGYRSVLAPPNWASRKASDPSAQRRSTGSAVSGSGQLSSTHSTTVVPTG